MTNIHQFRERSQKTPLQVRPVPMPCWQREDETEPPVFWVSELKDTDIAYWRWVNEERIKLADQGVRKWGTMPGFFVGMCLVDETTHEPFFKRAEVVKETANLSRTAVETLFDVAGDLNNLWPKVSRQSQNTQSGKRLRVPEWDGPDGRPVWVSLRRLSGFEVDHWKATNEIRDARLRNEESELVDAELGTSESHLVGMSLIDDDTKQPIFADDAAVLAGMKPMPGALVESLFKEAVKLNALNKGAGEEISKNSSSALATDSGSTSPEIEGAA